MLATTAHARQLFLYGNGDGKRIVNTRKLAELSGVHPETLRVYLPKCEKELEEMLAGAGGNGLVLRLREEDLNLHKQVLACIENQVKQCIWELETFDKIVASLESICDNFSLNTDNGDAALRLLENYLTARGTKADLRRQLLALHKHYTDQTGITSLLDIQTAAAKALETGRAKIKLKSEGAETVRDVTPAAGAANLLRG